MASRPGAAPGKLSFGDSAARAGARLIDYWKSKCTEVRSECASREIGAAAGSCARTFALARRHSAVKSQPQGK